MVDSVDASRAGALLTVDLGAIRDNYRLLAGMSKGACAAVMKADAYGLDYPPRGWLPPDRRPAGGAVP